MRIPRILTGLSLALLTGHGVAAAAEPPSEASSAPQLVRQSYRSTSGEERDAFVYLPAGYGSDRARRWPVLLFLHGDGERGDGKDDLDWVLAHGPLYEAWIQKRDLPFIVLAPQLPLFGRDETVDYIRDRKRSAIPQRLEEGVPPRPEEFPTPEPMTGATPALSLPFGAEGPPEGWPRREEDLLAILDQALATYRADPGRVYLTGLSYGGFGTWYLASRHPRRFAAVAPVVGWGHPDLMPPLAARRMPVWVFAGGRDPAVPVGFFYAGLNRLEELGHEDVRFTVHEDRGHDVWRRVYAGQDLYDWLLSHRLPDAEPRPEATTASPPPALESRLEIIDIGSGERRTVLRVEQHIEAPNWSPKGDTLVYNSAGHLYEIPVAGGRPSAIDTGFATRCNNDHGFSPDGEWLAISHAPGDESLIYVVAARGGTPRLVTEKGPSYWHGWSPDGETLAYCAERRGEYDVYVIPAAGGEETRLTDAPGLDDGPDYSPDGRHLYFNSERTGLMKIWRMKADGSEQEQVTFDQDYADWFPHPSPDGEHLVFLSYDRSVRGHPPNQDVVLRIMPLAGGEPRILAKLFGGQGTLNVPSWSPDGRQLAWVSYRLLR